MTAYVAPYLSLTYTWTCARCGRVAEIAAPMMIGGVPPNAPRPDGWTVEDGLPYCDRHKVVVTIEDL